MLNDTAIGGQNQSARRPERIRNRRDYLPPGLKGIFGVKGISHLARLLRKKRLKPNESEIFAWFLWKAGEHLDHAVCFGEVARESGIDVGTISRTVKAMLQGGLLQALSPDKVKAPFGRRQKSGRASIGFRFPLWADIERAINRYLGSASRKGQRAVKMMKAYCNAKRFVAALGARKLARAEWPWLPFQGIGADGEVEPWFNFANLNHGSTSINQGSTSDILAGTGVTGGLARVRVTESTDTEKTDKDKDETPPRVPAQVHGREDVQELAEKLLELPGDGDKEKDKTVYQMLVDAGVWPKRRGKLTGWPGAMELAACPKATLELVTEILARCDAVRPRPLNWGGYVARAVAKEVEPEMARRIRDIQQAGHRWSEIDRQRQFDRFHADNTKQTALAASQLEYYAAELSTGPPVPIGGVLVGRGENVAVARKGHLLIFPNWGANDGAAVHAFDLGERKLGRLPRVVTIVAPPEIRRAQGEATG